MPTKAERIAKDIIRLIGEDPDRDGVVETPARFAKALTEWFSGYGDANFDLKAFSDGADGYDELVVETNIPVYSHCEHHISPFFGVAHIGYVPDGKIVGLSKLPRLVNHFSRRLQVQERLTVQVAGAIKDALAPLGVAVVLQCRHMCMESRGIHRTGVITSTSSMHGIFRDEPPARAEFLGIVRGCARPA